MKEQDFNKLAPNGLSDLTEKVHAHLMKKGKAACEKCGVENAWVFSDLEKTNFYEAGRGRRTLLGLFTFICNSCHKQTRIMKPSDLGLRDDIEVEK